MRIAIKTIEIDPQILVRDQLDLPTVERYQEILDDLPPVKVMDLPDGRRVLTDGWHRTTAAMRLGRTEIEVELKSGSLHEAIAEGATANAQHGRQLTPDERKEAARRLLELGWSPQQVSKAVAMSQGWVADLIEVVRLRGKVSGALHLPDAVVESIARAPEEYQEKLVETAQSKRWTRDQVRDATWVIKSDVPNEHKEEVLKGSVNPTAVRYSLLGDEPRVTQDVIDEAGRRLRADAEYRAILTQRGWHELVLHIRRFINDEDWATMVSHLKVEELDRFLYDIKTIRQFLDDLEARARAQIGPRVERLK